MRWLMLTLALVGVSSASFLFGPAGMPSVWENIQSIGADSVRADYFSSTDSLYFYTSHYGFFVRQAAAAAGTRSIDIVLVEEDGSLHILRWNDAVGRFTTSENFESGGTLYCVAGTVSGSAGVNFTNATVGAVSSTSAPILIDANTSGSAFINLGQSGDADKVNLDSAELHTASTTYDSTATLAAGVYMCILNQAAGQDTLRLPAAASHTGRMVIIKCVNVNGSLVEGNGAELIDDSNEQALAQWDALQLFCDGTRWLIF